MSKDLNTKHVPERVYLTNNTIRIRCIPLIEKMAESKMSVVNIYGVPCGGIPVAYMLSGTYNILPNGKVQTSPSTKHVFTMDVRVVDEPNDAHFIVDDIIDSGSTRSKYKEKAFLSLYGNTDKIVYIDDSMPHYNPKTFTLASKYITGNEWIVFPWEATLEKSIDDHYLRMSQFHGIPVDKIKAHVEDLLNDVNYMSNILD